MDKKLKELPWAEFKGEENQTYSVSINEPVVDGERVFVITFSLNPAHVTPTWQEPKIALRFFCYKKSRQVFAYDKDGRKKKAYLKGGLGDKEHGACIGKREQERLELFLKDENQEERNIFFALSRWIRKVNGEMEAERKRRAGEVMAEDVALCPEELPEGLEEWIHRHILSNDNILVHKNGNKRGLCYACGNKVEATYPQRFVHNRLATCPTCGTKVLCQKEGGVSWRSGNVDNIVAVQKGKDGETVFFRQWRLLRGPTAEWEDIESHLLEVARYAIRGTKTAKWQKEYKINYFMYCDREPLDKWMQWKDNRIYDGFYSFYNGGATEALAGTAMQYADLNGYLNDEAGYVNPIYFLEYFAKYPVMEFLWKAGYRRVVRQKIWGTRKENAHAILWQRKQLKECFRFPLYLLKIRPAEEWGLEDMRITQTLWATQRGQLNAVELQSAIRLGEGFECIKTALSYANASKIEKYLEKQSEPEELDARYERIIEQTCRTYRDYLRECEELKLPLADKQILFPPNLEEAHQRTAAQISFEKNKADQEKFAKQVERWEPFAWEGKDYFVRPVREQKELQEEGQALKHCVGGYSKDVAEGKTIIFFIRKIQEPNKPFYTLELNPKTKKVCQCRTLQNASYEKNQEVHAFVEEWLKEATVKKSKKKVA